MAAGCHGADADQAHALGCAGAAVVITVTPPLAAPGDGKPSCTGSCDEYQEALRVAIERATPAHCLRRPLSNVLICAPSPALPEQCPRDTVDAATSLEPQIRDYLAGSWPEIDPAAVSLDTCVCHLD